MNDDWGVPQSQDWVVDLSVWERGGGEGRTGGRGGVYIYS